MISCFNDSQNNMYGEWFFLDGSHIGLLILLVILIALSACFSSAETAYSSLNVIRLKQMAKAEIKSENCIC